MEIRDVPKMTAMFVLLAEPDYAFSHFGWTWITANSSRD